MTRRTSISIDLSAGNVWEPVVFLVVRCQERLLRFGCRRTPERLATLRTYPET